jgi:two-component system LytT family response regulator
MTSRPPGERRLRVLIIDDEPMARRTLKLALAGRADVDIVGEARGAGEGSAKIMSLEPDVVLLDVQMPDGDGFDVLRAIPEGHWPSVIMVTAFDEYAVRAFEHHAVDYVLKPFTDARLFAAIDHAARMTRQASEADRSRALQSALAALGPLPAPSGRRFPRRILVKKGEASGFVAIADIDWLEASSNYVRIHAGAEEHLVRGSLSGLLAELDPAEFVRIHRSRAVQVNRIREILPWFTGDFIAVLHDGRRLRVSRNYRDQLLKPLI